PAIRRDELRHVRHGLPPEHPLVHDGHLHRHRRLPAHLVLLLHGRPVEMTEQKESDMGNKLVRSFFAVLMFVVTIQWSRPAQAAPMTITGTVGEVGTYSYVNVGAVVKFKMTNANLTAACTDPMPGNFNNVDIMVAGYAWFLVSDAGGKEWYAALLYSKKGA